MRSRKLGYGFTIRGPLYTDDLLVWKDIQKDDHNDCSLILLYGSWNQPSSSFECDSFFQLLKEMQHIITTTTASRHVLHVSTLQVDQDEICESICIGDFDKTIFADNNAFLPLNCPGTLPAIACIIGNHLVSYVSIPSFVITRCISSLQQQQQQNDEDISSMKESLMSSIVTTVENTLSEFDMQEVIDHNLPTVATPTISQKTKEAIRIFIAGDRSKVGKSSVCLGLLGSLLRSEKYPPSSLAYIKPATQCESTQLVTEFCNRHGIDARPIGPLLYYKGFTRAFLQGQTESSDELLQKCASAVDTIAQGKKIVIIDGVGYPAVGSICGTDNAQVAKACGYLSTSDPPKRISVPVLLVGKSGVGDAIDSYNLNSTYFTANNVPVLGCIFNRLSMEGFYSLENCKKAVTAYFDKFKSNDEIAYGFIPEVPGIANTRDDDNNDNELEKALEHANQFVSIFASHVNVDQIINNATIYQEQCLQTNGSSSSSSNKRVQKNGTHSKPNGENNNIKKIKLSPQPHKIQLTREQIEEAAKSQGAAGG